MRFEIGDEILSNLGFANDIVLFSNTGTLQRIIEKKLISKGE